MNWTREPLVHFLVAAAAIVAVDAWLGAPAERTIRVPAARAADADSYVRDEILWREAVARGLDESPAARALAISRVESILVEPPPEPTEAELRAAYETDGARWSRPGRVDLDQVTFSQGANIPPGTREQLETGAPFWTLGEASGPGASLRGVEDPELRATFGDAFADSVAVIAPGSWHGPWETSAGRTFVRVVGRSSPEPLTFGQARGRIREALLAEATERAIAARVRELREEYRIEIEKAR
ncbi:MAG: peptidylprolyl isomerase [bacterium]|nr:peptidyl-prolyl cis-trans isomerase [Gemmatimonadota bacterium]